jgi:hypothetical protein
MGVVDYSIKNFLVTIGDLDITPMLTKFEMSRPIHEMGQNLCWEGSFSLAFVEGLGLIENRLDPITNAAYFRPLQKVCSITIQGSIIAYFYISEYKYDAYKKEGSGSIVQLLTMAEGNYISKEIPTKLDDFGTPLGTVIQNLLKEAYNDSLYPNPAIALDLSVHTGTLDDRLTSSDPAKDACEFAGKNYYFLYVDRQNRIAQISGDPDKLNLIYSLAANECEYEPAYEKIQFASDKFIVTGSKNELKKDDGFTTGITFKLKKAENGKESFDSQGRKLQLITETYKKKYEIFPGTYTKTVRDGTGYRVDILDSTDILYERKTVEYKYWGISTDFHVIDTVQSNPPVSNNILPQVRDFQGKIKHGTLTQTITTIERIKSAFLGDPKINDSTLRTIGGLDTVLVPIEKIVEVDWARVIYKAKSLSEYEAVKEESAFSIATNWDFELQLSTSEPITNGRIDPDGSIPEVTDPTTGKPIKLIDYQYTKEDPQKEPELDLEETIIKGEANFIPVGWNTFRKEPYTVELGFIPSQNHANYLALQLGKRELRRRDAIQVTCSPKLEWIAQDIPPLYRIYVDKYEVLVDEEILSIEEGEMKYGFTGEIIGILPTPVPLIPDPIPFVPSQTLYLSTQNIQAIATNNVNFQLSVSGGAPPYTYSSTNLPSGLSISPTGLITGLTTSTGIVNATINVSDSLGSLAAFNLSFSITPNLPAIALNQNPSNFEDGSTTDTVSFIAEIIYESASTDSYVDSVSVAIVYDGASTNATPLAVTISDIADGSKTDVSIGSVFFLIEGTSSNVVVQFITPITDATSSNVVVQFITPITDATSSNVVVQFITPITDATSSNVLLI